MGRFDHLVTSLTISNDQVKVIRQIGSQFFPCTHKTNIWLPYINNVARPLDSAVHFSNVRATNACGPVLVRDIQHLKMIDCLGQEIARDRKS
jgi:hypothetical protein